MNNSKSVSAELRMATIHPHGLSRVEAAAYIGISPSLFDRLVGDGRMPRPIFINSRRVWDQLLLDEAFDALLGDGANSDTNAWDETIALSGGGKRSCVSDMWSKILTVTATFASIIAASDNRRCDYPAYPDQRNSWRRTGRRSLPRRSRKKPVDTTRRGLSAACV